MKNFKKIISGFISLALAVSLMASPLLLASASAEKMAAAGAADKTKISADLANRMEQADEDDLIPVYIFRYLMPEEKLQSLVYEETGMDIAVYEDAELFESQIAPVIEKRAEALYGYEKAHAVDPGTLTSLAEDAITAEMNHFLAEKRSIVNREYTLANAEFKEEHIGDARAVLYDSGYTPTLIVEATKAEILAYAELADVEKIMYFENLENKPYLDSAEVQAGADFTKENGYTGFGTVIAVIEAEAGMYDPNSMMLSGIPATQLSYIDNVRTDGTVVAPVISTHATKVTEIIVGQSVTLGGYLTYEGFAPQATVYQTAVITIADLYTAFDIMVAKGVHVMNFSAGVDTTGYTAYDLEIDRKIAATNVSFVVAAGNNGAEVGSPGKAVNAVTVGAVDTKLDAFAPLPEPYTIASYSSYVEAASYLPNKPDISAPGSLLSTPATASSVNVGSGTSYAAPIITAVMAQTMQRTATFKTNPYAAKSFIILCAEYARMNTAGESSVGNYLYDKSGSGLIWAPNLMEAFTIVFAPLPATGYTTASDPIYLAAGQQIRAVLVFGKTNTFSINSSTNTDDIDLSLYDSSGNLVASSISSRNTTEIIEYSAPAAGTYTLQANAHRVIDPISGAVPVAITYMIK